MLKNFKWIEREGYYSQKIGKHEVTVERLPKLHRLSLWKDDAEELVESHDFEGTDLSSLLRAFALGDQLLKQNSKKRG